MIHWAVQSSPAASAACTGKNKDASRLAVRMKSKFEVFVTSCDRTLGVNRGKAEFECTGVGGPHGNGVCYSDDLRELAENNAQRGASL